MTEAELQRVVRNVGDMESFALTYLGTKTPAVSNANHKHRGNTQQLKADLLRPWTYQMKLKRKNPRKVRTDFEIPSLNRRSGHFCTFFFFRFWAERGCKPGGLYGVMYVSSLLSLSSPWGTPNPRPPDHLTLQHKLIM